MTTKQKYTRSAWLLLSTLLVPLQLLGVILYFIPFLYVYFVVPYLLDRIWFGEEKQKIQKYSLLWKIPLIISFVIALYPFEILAFSISVTASSFITIAASSTALFWIFIIIIFAFLLLSIRCIAYAMIIFVWRPNILKSRRILAYIGIVVYFIAALYLGYSFQNASGIDDYSAW